MEAFVLLGGNDGAKYAGDDHRALVNCIWTAKRAKWRNLAARTALFSDNRQRLIYAGVRTRNNVDTYELSDPTPLRHRRRLPL